MPVHKDHVRSVVGLSLQQKLLNCNGLTFRPLKLIAKIIITLTITCM